MDTPQAAPDDSSFRKTQAPLVAMFVLHVAACVFIVRFLVDWETVLALYAPIGFAIGQAMMLGLWAALGTSRAIIRIPASLSLLSLCVATFMTSFWRLDAFMPATIGIGILIVSHWLAIQAPLWALRVARDHRFARASDLMAKSAADRQFGIGGLLLVMAVVGLLVAVGRFAHRAEALEELFGTREKILGTLILISGNLVLGLMATRAALAPRHLIYWSAVSAPVALGGALVVAYAVARIDGRSLAENQEFGLTICGVEYVCIFGTMLLARLAGYRWLRLGAMVDELVMSIDKQFWRERAPIVLLVAINAVACVAVALIPTDRPNDKYPMIAMGISVSQTMLLALWAALGTGPAILRVISSLALLVAPMVANAVFARRESNSWQFGVSVAVVIMLHWLVGQLPLWIARLAFSIEVNRANSPPPEKRRQFSVGQLLWVTAIVGILLAAGRFAYNTGSFDDFLDDRESATVAAILVTGDLFVCLLAMFAALTRRMTVVWMAISLIFTCLVSWTMVIAYHRLFKLAAPGEFNILYWLIGTEFVWLTGCSLLLRLAGFRWLRRSLKEESPQTKL